MNKIKSLIIGNFKFTRLKNKKGMTLQVVVTFALILFLAIVVILISKGKMDQVKNIGTSCENNNGQCVKVSECGVCSNYADCKMRYPYECEYNMETKEKLICCPN